VVASAAMRRILFLAVLLVSVSCASLPGFEKPEVTLAGLDIDNVEIFETEGTVTIRIVNGDRKPITVDGSSFHLYLEGSKIGRAVSSERVEIEGLSSTTLEVPLFISNLRLASRVYSIFDQQSDINYRIKSKLWLVAPVGTRKIRLEHTGQFDLDRPSP